MNEDDKTENQDEKDTPVSYLEMFVEPPERKFPLGTVVEPLKPSFPKPSFFNWLKGLFSRKNKW